MSVQIRGKHFAEIRSCFIIRHPIESGGLPRLRITLDNERTRLFVELVRMRRKRPGCIFAKRERQSMKQLIRAVPDVTMRAQIKLRLELFEVVQANSAVHAVRGD